MMYLPELNHISQQRYSLSGFGGVNRRETAEVGEFADAVNLSSDEYPLIMPRKRYDVGVFPKTALMWHNNDRDMALVPYLALEDVVVISSQNEITNAARELPAGDHYIIYTADTMGMVEYFVTDPGDMITAVSNKYVLVPGKAYKLTKNGWLDDNGCILGNIGPVEGNSRIIYKNGSVDIPTVVAFKNPVYANSGTSTVICDEINGMWVLEYDKNSDTYSYNRVQNKYTVMNEYEGTTSGKKYIVGGSYCHLRLWFEDDTMIENIQVALTEEAFTRLIEKKTDDGLSYVYANHLIAYGAKPNVDCTWYRLLASGGLEPVDFLHYEFCTLDGSTKFRAGDYVELKMSGIWNRDPDLKEELADLDGMYDIVKIRENQDGVKYSLVLKGAIRRYGTINALIMDTGAEQREGESTLNNKYLDDGMTIERKAPENVRFICAHMNRIWANNGNNEIMCCTRGNPYVWYRYEGNTLDSWAVTIGGDGSFTGCISYEEPIFFKENAAYCMSGGRPSNFGYKKRSIKGIKNGCHDSAVIVNDVLYYQSIDGIYAYNASPPARVSDKIYKDWQRGKACRFRDKYYIAVTEYGKNRLYCYDTRSGVWHREDMGEKEIRYLYPGRYLDGYEEYMTVYTDCDEENYTGYTVSSADDYIYRKEDPVKWSFETTDLLAAEPETKYLKGIYVSCRVYPEEENEIELSVQYGGDGEWRSLGNIEPQNGDSRCVWYKYPMAGKRCENLKIKAEGTGKSVLYNITLEFEKGSAKK